jgi:hypothetical protein
MTSRLHTVARLGPSAAIVLCAGIAFADPAPVQYGPWEPVRSDDGIVIHRRKVGSWPVHEFRGRTIVDAPLDEVLALLEDTAARPKWMNRCTEAHDIERGAAGEAVCYERTGAQWPVKDRDVVMRTHERFDVEKKRVEFEFHSIEDARLPPVKGVVRMPYLKGHFYLRAVEGGKKTWIEYQGHAVPGGAVPDWITNSVSKQVPHSTLKAMKRYLKERSYASFKERLEQRADYRDWKVAVEKSPPGDPAIQDD